MANEKMFTLKAYLIERIKDHSIRQKTNKINDLAFFIACPKININSLQNEYCITAVKKI